MELLQILHVEGSRLSSVQMPAMRSRVNHACDQIIKMGGLPHFGVHDPIFKFNNSLEPVADLQKTIAYCYQINMQNITWGRKTEGMCRAKGEGGVPSLCARVGPAPSHQLPVFTNQQAPWDQFLRLSF